MVTGREESKGRKYNIGTRMEAIMARKRNVDTYKLIFEIVDEVVKKKKLYLRVGLTLTGLAREVGINRTYVSHAIRKYGGSFRLYLNRQRIDYVMSDIVMEDEPGNLLNDGEGVALEAGFINKRSMDRAFNNILGMTYNVSRMREKSRRRKSKCR